MLKRQKLVEVIIARKKKQMKNFQIQQAINWLFPRNSRDIEREIQLDRREEQRKSNLKK